MPAPSRGHTAGELRDPARAEHPPQGCTVASVVKGLPSAQRVPLAACAAPPEQRAHSSRLLDDAERKYAFGAGRIVSPKVDIII